MVIPSNPAILIIEHQRLETDWTMTCVGIYTDPQQPVCRPIEVLNMTPSNVQHFSPDRCATKRTKTCIHKLT